MARIPAPDPSGRQTRWWDSKVKGFGIVASGATKAKSYIVQGDVRGQNRNRRITLGPVDAFEVDEAREKARALLTKMRRGEDPVEEERLRKAADITLSEVLEHYLRHNRRLGQRTRGEYRRLVETHFSAWLNKPAREISRDDVLKRHAQIAEGIKARARTREATGGTTANYAVRVLRTLFNWALSQELGNLQTNPAKLHAKAWYPARRRQRVLSADELPGFWRAVRDLPSPVHAAYLELVLFTGLRASEAATLTWQQVNYTNKPRGHLPAYSLYLPESGTKAHRALTLPLSDHLVDLFVRLRALGLEEDWCFASPTSKKGYLQEPRNSLIAACRAAGITEHVRPHDLRRTYCTVAESSDIPHYALKALMNHALTDVTGQHYLVMDVERLRAPMQRVTDRMKALCQVPEPEAENVTPLSKEKEVGHV
ncbi:tyrosine-type recombinase/integrase [Aquisalimonas lutea]|uniref:tyrosine-type recombinase/integrase n=1 Tax=Aquisalimonas lutea TaxID=1327750 RepID=UPI0025B4881D|nr:tyrosine-type recombinase/integrase [Aquisalimonas lutea]MDN3517052.1 tyrosine-type recombinase/integrase [Aquisalimonas lutea]